MKTLAALRAQKHRKDKFSLYLSVSPIKSIKKNVRGKGLSLSEVIDEAIISYVKQNKLSRGTK